MGRSAKKRENSSEGGDEEAEERPREPAAKRRRAAEKPAAPDVDQARERLRRLALENGLLSLAPSSTSTPLRPSKTALKQDGRDVVKKGARKNRFLFALPGLLAPISGGKIGELADLHTKKPVLYIDFPQGRMKLFGTIIYPKNKYLTLQLAKTSKNILCEDWFENMVVFSDAWWIGTKEENPEELKLKFPENLKEVNHMEFDFKGGVGDAPKDGSYVDKSAHEHAVTLSPKTDLTNDASEDSGPLTAKTLNDTLEVTPTRHSARTAGKTVAYAEASSEDEDVDSDSPKEGSDSSGVSVVKDKKLDQQAKDSNKEAHSSVVGEDAHVREQSIPSVKAKKSSAATERSRESSKRKQGGLVQATLSTLFEKVAVKKSKNGTTMSLASKGSDRKVQSPNSKKKTRQEEVKGSNDQIHRKNTRTAGAGTKALGKQKQTEEFNDYEDDIEEISSD